MDIQHKFGVVRIGFYFGCKIGILWNNKLKFGCLIHKQCNPTNDGGIIQNSFEFGSDVHTEPDSFSSLFNLPYIKDCFSQMRHIAHSKTQSRILYNYCSKLHDIILCSECIGLFSFVHLLVISDYLINYNRKLYDSPCAVFILKIWINALCNSLFMQRDQLCKHLNEFYNIMFTVHMDIPCELWKCEGNP